MTHFATLHPDGSLSAERNIDQSVLRSCPHFILDPSHYPTDKDCDCRNKAARYMKDWGYKWDRILSIWR